VLFPDGSGAAVSPGTHSSTHEHFPRESVATHGWLAHLNGRTAGTNSGGPNHYLALLAAGFNLIQIAEPQLYGHFVTNGDDLHLCYAQ